MRKLYNTSPGHSIDPDTIHDDGIWGVVGENLNANDALAIGCTLGVMLKTKDQCLVVVGTDNRTSSAALESEMSRGLAASGCYVVRVGIVPLPALLFSAHWMEASVIMISGGTRPPDVNGFSIYIDQIPVRAERLKRICGLAANGHWKEHRGGALDGDILDVYLHYLKQKAKFKRSFKVAWDLGGGTACQIIPQLSDTIKGEHLLMHETLDASFADMPLGAFAAPRVQTIQEVVVSEGCDLGIIISADSIQIAVVDNDGILCSADTLYILLLRHIYPRLANPTVMVDMSTRLAVMREIKRLGINMTYTTHGSAGIHQQMVQQKAQIGSDGEGRYIFAADEKNTSFDALQTALSVLQIIAEKEQSLSSLNAQARTSHRQKHFFVADAQPETNIKTARTALLKKNLQPIDIDGLRFETELGWWWMRPDRQQEKKGIALSIEATTLQDISTLAAEVQALLPDVTELEVTEDEPAAKNNSKPTTAAVGEGLKEISDDERESIEFVSRYWGSLRMKKSPSQ